MPVSLRLSEVSRRSFLVGSAGAAAMLWAKEEGGVQVLKAPGGALQPQAVIDGEGVVHLIYLYGDPAAANVGYVRKGPEEAAFSAPIRVNSQPGSAVALGSVRGAHLALGKAGRIHVAWNGSSSAKPKGPHSSAPMLYSRLNDSQNGFEPERSVMTVASGLDGGGTVAADGHGNVFVAWHAQGQRNGKPMEGEDHRRVWLARSSDEGHSFGTERPVSPEALGACGCCGMGALVGEDGNLYLLYRSARESVHRDMFLLTSRDQGETFQPIDLHPWNIGACPMSTVSLTSKRDRVFLSWETAKQVYFSHIDSHTLRVDPPIAAPGGGGSRKHPAIAVGENGQTLLVWTEGTGWKRGGSLAWQVFDEAGKPVGQAGASPALPAWDFATAVWANGRFVVVS